MTAAAIPVDDHEFTNASSGASRTSLRSWLADRLYRFLERLPEQDEEFDLEVLKRCPAPV